MLMATWICSSIMAHWNRARKSKDVVTAFITR